MRSQCFTFSSHAGTICYVNLCSLEKYTHILWAGAGTIKQGRFWLYPLGSWWRQELLGASCKGSWCAVLRIERKHCRHLSLDTGDVGQLWPQIKCAPQDPPLSRLTAIPLQRVWGMPAPSLLCSFREGVGLWPPAPCQHHELSLPPLSFLSF